MKIFNELGNPIEIDVTLPQGISQTPFQAVVIRIEGPHSLCENTITLAEAKALLQLLELAVGGNQNAQSTQAN